MRSGKTWTLQCQEWRVLDGVTRTGGSARSLALRSYMAPSTSAGSSLGLNLRTQRRLSAPRALPMCESTAQQIVLISPKKG